MRNILCSAARHAALAAATACAACLVMSCAFGDEDAVQSLFQETENPLVVAVGESLIYLSQTGMLWSGNMIQTNDSLRDVAYGMGTFIAVGSGAVHPGVAYLSEDGMVWLGPVGFSNTLNAVACYNKYFIAGGEGFIKVSLDGMVWVPVCKVGVNTIYDFAVGNGRIVAVGGDGATGKVYVSSDGLGWAGPSTIDGVIGLNKIAYGNETFIATTSSTRLIASRDGLAWAVNEGPSVLQINAIAFGKKLFVGIDENNIAYTSPDGLIWTQIGTAGIPGAVINDLEFCYGSFIGVGHEGVTIVSPNGLVWRGENFPGLPLIWGLGCRH